MKVIAQWFGFWPVVDHSECSHFHSQRANAECEAHEAHMIDNSIHEFLAFSPVS